MVLNQWGLVLKQQMDEYGIEIKFLSSFLCVYCNKAKQRSDVTAWLQLFLICYTPSDTKDCMQKIVVGLYGLILKSFFWLLFVCFWDIAIISRCPGTPAQSKDMVRLTGRTKLGRVENVRGKDCQYISSPADWWPVRGCLLSHDL